MAKSDKENVDKYNQRLNIENNAYRTYFYLELEGVLKIGISNYSYIREQDIVNFDQVSKGLSDLPPDYHKSDKFTHNNLKLGGDSPKY